MRLATFAMLVSALKASSRPVAAFSFRQECGAFLLKSSRHYHQQRLIPAKTALSPRRSHALFNSNSNNDEAPTIEPMANIYTEWSIDDDKLLFENRRKSLPELAAMLGRGLRGIESRLAKLTDINSPAYARLFIGQNKGKTDDDDDDDDDNSNNRLVPAKEILRRIQWDYYLTESDFTVLHYDRVDDDIVESPMSAPNTSVKGKETLLVLAIPEHRIAAIRYKERIVWDKENRIDRVFGSMGGDGETISDVMAGYDEWKARKDATDEWNRKRQAEVSLTIQRLLGDERFGALKQLSTTLLDTFSNQEDDVSNQKRHVETYVEAALQLFRDARREQQQQDASSSSSSEESDEQLAEEDDDDDSETMMSDYDSLDTFSELVALLPDSGLRPAILMEISMQMKKLIGRKGAPAEGDDAIISTIPELDENDLVESFVKGSGAGGQKVNKTANKVVLLHEPTQLRVECQDTRSLQQNRKIARKRLRLKLDEFLNGSQSKIGVKNTKKKSKKAKAKARSKARLKKKKNSKSTEEE